MYCVGRELCRGATHTASSAKQVKITVVSPSQTINLEPYQPSCNLLRLGRDIRRSPITQDTYRVVGLPTSASARRNLFSAEIFCEVYDLLEHPSDLVGDFTWGLWQGGLQY